MCVYVRARVRVCAYVCVVFVGARACVRVYDGGRARGWGGGWGGKTAIKPNTNGSASKRN